MPRLPIRALVGAVLIALSVSLLSVGRAEAAPPPNCGAFTSDVIQLVRPATQANLLTRSASEVQSAQAYGFTDNRGVLAQVAGSAGTGLVPVWRLYRSGDFVWATDAHANSFVSQGYAKQFVEFYAAAEDNDCLSPISRLERNGIHRMADETAIGALVNDGWRLEVTAFYAVTDEQPPPPPPPGTDTTFSIAVIPDTQNESNSASDTRFRNRAAWLVANKQARDLRYAMQIGDFSNWGHVAPAQFEKLSTEVRPLEAAMPWAGAIGNHDTAAVCAGGSACPGANTSVTVRDTSTYNRYFPVSRFPNIGGTYEAGKVDNAYATYGAGGVNWLVLTLELWPRTGAVNWAENVVASHPGHNVIVVTHAYLESDGSIGRVQRRLRRHVSAVSLRQPDQAVPERQAGAVRTCRPSRLTNRRRGQRQQDPLVAADLPQLHQSGAAGRDRYCSRPSDL